MKRFLVYLVLIMFSVATYASNNIDGKKVKITSTIYLGMSQSACQSALKKKPTCKIGGKYFDVTDATYSNGKVTAIILVSQSTMVISDSSPKLNIANERNDDYYPVVRRNVTADLNARFGGSVKVDFTTTGQKYNYRGCVSQRIKVTIKQ